MTGIGRFTGETAFWLANHGYDVTVLTTPPHYPAWRVQGPFSSARIQSSKVEGATILRFPVWIPATPTGLKRSLFLLSFALSSLPYLAFAAFRQRPDVIFVTQPSLFLLPGSLFFGRLAGSTVWLHTQDAELLAAERLGLVSKRYLLRLAKNLEHFLLNATHRLTAISPNLGGHIESVSGRSDIGMFPNWVDCDVIRPEIKSGFREALGLADRFVVLYSGSIGAKQGFETVIEAARILRTNDTFHFVVATEGPAARMYQEASQDLRNMTWLPLQPYDRFPELMTLADAHVLPQRADVEQAVLPSKLGPMLASGRPILAGAREGSALANEIRGCGLLFSPNSSIELASLIETLAAGRDSSAALGSNARLAALERWDREPILKRFELDLRKYMRARE